MLSVLLPEKCGIRQPRAHDALVAFADLRRLAAFDVAHGDEPRHEHAVGVFKRKIALVILQGADQDLARQREEPRIKGTRDGNRPLDERGHFVEELCIEQRPAAERVGFGGCKRAHLFAALREIGHHVAALAQQAHVACGCREPDGRRGEETVALRLVAGARFEQGRGDDFLAVKHHQPVHRAHEFCGACAPAHAFGDRQAIECRLHDCRQKRDGIEAGFRADEKEKRALGLLE